METIRVMSVISAELRAAHLARGLVLFSWRVTVILGCARVSINQQDLAPQKATVKKNRSRYFRCRYEISRIGIIAHQYRQAITDWTVYTLS